jgi:predicted O-linked N-acetylglucosamine transferase (SPINDLY family)
VTTQQALQTALNHQQAGRLAEAERIYRQVLQTEPRNVDALHGLGLLAQQLGMNADAVALIESAHRFGRPRAASLNALGKAYLGLGRPQEARRCFGKAVALQPDHAEAHVNLGVALGELGRPAEAERSHRRAAILQPDDARAHYNLGNALRELGRLDEARESYARATALKPEDAETRNNLAITLCGLGRLAEAEPEYRAALAAKSDYLPAYHNLGNLLRDLGRPAEAERVYRQALALEPRLAPTLVNLGNALKEQGRLEEAGQAYREALALEPGAAEIHYNLGNVLYQSGQLDEAHASYRRALALKPDFAEARWELTMNQLPPVYGSAEEQDTRRRAFSRELAALRAWADDNPAVDGARVVGAPPFYLPYQEEDNRGLLADYGRLCAELMQRCAGARSPAPIRSAAGDRVRVGIVSAHVGDHSVWNAIVKGWISHLDPQRFELGVFHLGSGEDGETRLARARASHFDQGRKSLGEWAAVIREQRPEVLIYPEVGMDALTARLASLRLAPVQVATWGHPETTGLPTIDCYLSAAGMEPPGAQAHYTERLVLLPGLGCCYAPPDVAGVEPEFVGLGVDPGVPTLVCAGKPFKYAPQHDRVLVEIARALGRCQLVFFTHQTGALTEQLRHRLRGAFARAGLDFDRHGVFVPWQPRPAFHGLLKRADVYLDTIGFSGFNTAMQAVECGLPIVAREGRFLRGRFASGILRRMGLPELVAGSEEEYVALAVKLAADDGYRRGIRTRLEASRPLLFEDAAPIRALEEFLIGAVRQSPQRPA